MVMIDLSNVPGVKVTRTVATKNAWAQIFVASCQSMDLYPSFVSVYCVSLTTDVLRRVTQTIVIQSKKPAPVVNSHGLPCSVDMFS
jgi:hypothetical protein